MKRLTIFAASTTLALTAGCSNKEKKIKYPTISTVQEAVDKLSSDLQVKYSSEGSIPEANIQGVRYSIYRSNKPILFIDAAVGSILANATVRPIDPNNREQQQLVLKLQRALPTCNFKNANFYFRSTGNVQPSSYRA